MKRVEIFRSRNEAGIPRQEYVSMQSFFQIFMMGCIAFAFYSKSVPMAIIGIAAELASLNWDSMHAFIMRIKDVTLRGSQKGIQFTAKRDVTVAELLTAPGVSKELKKSVYEAAATAEISVGPENPLALTGFIGIDEAVKRVAALPDIVEFSKGKRIAYLPSEAEAYALKGALNPSYQIQVAEKMDTHYATYDFIYIDAKTGEVVHREHY